MDGLCLAAMLGLDGYSFPCVDYIPERLRESFAQAFVYAVDQLTEARGHGDMVNQDRALKALHILPILLLRIPPASDGRGPRHAAVVAARFAKWSARDFEGLLADLAADAMAALATAPERAAARARARADAGAEPSLEAVRRAVGVVNEGY
jgi:hypothetical protein